MITRNNSPSNAAMDAVIAAVTPEAAAYQDRRTGGTPLHMAAQLVGDCPDPCPSLLSVLSELLQAHPEAVQRPDAAGHIPLHYAIAPSSTSASDSDNSTLPPASWKFRTQAVRLLLAADSSQGSVAYLARHNVLYGNGNNGASSTGGVCCSPLYRALQCLPDDDTPQMAPTLAYLNFLLQTLSSSPNTKMPEIASRGNASDGDKPLALLYRRFTRQFDLAEKFFAGDNSRPPVVRHRLKYKTAAGNTWKMMELLLQQVGNNNLHRKPLCTYRTVHFAVQGETPPDLLRYIVETNAHDLTVKDEAGNLPLHYAAKSRPPASLSDSAQDSNKNGHYPAFYSKYVIDELLYKFPEACREPDAHGLFPLALAVQSGKQWIGGGIKSLYDAYPEAIQQIDLGEHPVLKRALSMDLATAEQEREEKNDTILRDEPYDAIMLVQQADVDVSEVVTSMWAHEEDAGVQMLGCVAVSRMLSSSSLSEASRQKQQQPPLLEDVLRIALTAVPAVVNAMKAHPNEVIVQEKACHALQQMAVTDGKREISFVASGAVAAIVGAMQAHVSDPGVQQEACTALTCILRTTGGVDRATVVASVSGMTAMVNAVAAHPEHEGVQVAGCRALLALTKFDGTANLPDLPRQQTEPLLKAAKNRFPERCGPVVEALLSRMANTS